MSEKAQPAGWAPQTRTRRWGLCPVCGTTTEVSVSVRSMVRGHGAGGFLGSASVTLCNQHALELFAEASAAIERYRAGRTGAE